MFTAVLIDDESDALELLELILHDHFSTQIKVIAKTSEFREGVILLKEYQPDVLFLDIDLGEVGSGFDLLEQVKGLDKVPKVVFTTGYQQFAIKAVRIQAFDYLLKPIGADEINSLLKRLENESDTPEAHRPTNLAPGVIVHTSDAIYRIETDTISYFEGNGNYTNIHLRDKEKPILASVTLNFFEKEVQRVSPRFFRIHKSYLVNLNAVDRVEKKGLSRSLRMKEKGKPLPISRLRFKEFLTAYT